MDERLISTPLAAPHVLIFPIPIQGHVNSMLKLAELLSLAGVRVTFLTSQHNHRLLLRNPAAQSRFSRYPGLRFEAFDDGLPPDHPRAGYRSLDLIHPLSVTAGPLLRELLPASSRATASLERNAPPPPPITCVVADGVMGFAIDAAKEVGVPVMYFRTVSACCLWAYLCIPRLIQAGEFPFQGNDMDQLIMSIPGMEGKIRRRDLPSFLRVGNPSDPNLHFIISETLRTPEAHALILNTTEDLESPILARIRSHCPRVYALGPLHALLKSRLPAAAAAGTAHPPPSLSNSLWEEDRGCIAWLDEQPPGSVIYVSFGSLAVTTEEDIREIWHGLVNSGVRFLWVVRPDSVVGLGGGPATGILPEGSTTTGRVVGWAPQEEVLAHRAVGGFLTHSGWNSTLESMAAGKPMLCWAFFADQQINSRFVSEVWRVGLDMKDTCDRATVERLVRDLMLERKDELTESAAAIAESIRRNVAEGGASYRDMDRLVEDIRGMSVGPPH